MDSFVNQILHIRQESFKIPKGDSESVNHNGQQKKNKGTNNDLLNIHIKLKMELHEPH